MPITAFPRPWSRNICARTASCPEKNDLNSLLFLLTPGVESSKAGTLLSTLVAFKRLHDDNARLDDVISEFVRRRPARYSGVRLRDLCGEMHGFFRDSAASTLQRAQFAPEHLPTLAMPPHEAVRQLVRNNVDYLPISQAFGRIATTMFVVYPPGIASIVPGERLDERARPMLDYLRCSSAAPTCFPASRSRSRASTARSKRTARSGSTPTWYGNSCRRPAARQRPAPTRAASEGCRSSGRT